MAPDTFLDKFTDPTWFDPAVRPKTMKACLALCERILDKIVNELPRIVLFAPDAGEYGRCIPLMPNDFDSDAAFIYLAPSLESRPQVEVNFTVAHEFAHALVRHHLPQNMILSPEEAKRGYLESNSEIAADKLVAEWGFRVPKRRSRDRKRQISNDEKT